MAWSKTLKPGHVYLIAFDSGIVKVGQSKNPDQRLDEHARLAAIHGAGEVLRETVRVDDMDDWEEQLIAHFEAEFKRAGQSREYFHADSGQALALFRAAMAKPIQRDLSHGLTHEEKCKAAVTAMAGLNTRGDKARWTEYVKYFSATANYDRDPLFLKLLQEADHLYCVRKNRHCADECGCDRTWLSGYGCRVEGCTAPGCSEEGKRRYRQRREAREAAERARIQERIGQSEPIRTTDGEIVGYLWPADDGWYLIDVDGNLSQFSSEPGHLARVVLDSARERKEPEGIRKD
ncbi:hypothetical protein GCM10010191_22030 [Actinomadura vinacea]|uniref:Bacteriophage T5 Orf172 DNA-binding domain-containing protein n=1 Tax=Actinomadura vinacea TaxID=115336 RepID=A0ABP5VUR3_9ACTN